MCRLSWNLGTSTSWNPQGLLRPVQGFVVPFTYDLKFLWPPPSLWWGRVMRWSGLLWRGLRSSFYICIDQLKICYGVHEKTNTQTGMMGTVFRINEGSWVDKMDNVSRNFWHYPLALKSLNLVLTRLVMVAICAHITASLQKGVGLPLRVCTMTNLFCLTMLDFVVDLILFAEEDMRRR